MSKILRQHWSFENNLTLKPYYLGQVIDLKKEHKNLKKSNEGEYDYEYIGKDKYLFALSIKNNIVIRIIYKENFPIPNFEFWDNNYDAIEGSLIKTNKLVSDNYLKDKMCVIVRDGFVRLIILQKGKE